jgi:hypothetical protein
MSTFLGLAQELLGILLLARWRNSDDSIPKLESVTPAAGLLPGA